MSMIREFVDGVTFREFRAVAEREGWTVADILDRIGPSAFGGPSTSWFYESPTAYLTRVLRRGHTVDNDTVIPYRCLLQLYVEATRYSRAIPQAIRRCACGCGSAVVPGTRPASPAAATWTPSVGGFGGCEASGHRLAFAQSACTRR
jgi:hypothetical protein